MFFKETNFKEDILIGKLPKEWHTATLNDLGLLQYGITTSATEENTGVKLLRITDIKENGVIDWQEAPYCKIDIANSEKYQLIKGDVLFARIGATTGKTCYIEKAIKSVFGSYLIRFQSHKEEEIDPLFVYYYTQSGIYWHQVNKVKEGQLKKGLNTQLLYALRLPKPTLSEQQGIVEVLSCVDLAIQKTDEVIAKTERLKKGLMQKLLIEGIGHKEYKDIPIGRIPKNWQMAKLIEVSEEVIIGNVNPATPFYTTAEEGIPYFRSQNVRENNLVPTNTYVKREFNQIHPKSILRENDVLTIQTGFIGTSCPVPKNDEGSNCHSLLITRTNPQLLNPQFLCYFLNSDAGKKTIMKHNAGWGRDHLLLEDFRKVEIPIPPLAEQERISNVLSTIYQKAMLERTEKSRLERVKVGLMDLLLKGKVSVRMD